MQGNKKNIQNEQLKRQIQDIPKTWECSDQSSMLSLAEVRQNDFAYRTDFNPRILYRLEGLDKTLLTNWKQVGSSSGSFTYGNIGDVMPSYSEIPPVGCLRANGQTVTKVSCPQLWTWLQENVSRYSTNILDTGKFYVTTSHIRLPNFQDVEGRFVRSTNGTRVAGDLQLDDFKSHSHLLTDPGHSHIMPHNNDDYNGVGGGNQSYEDDANIAMSYDRWTTSATTGISLANSGGVETRPVSVTLYYYVRVEKEILTSKVLFSGSSISVTEGTNGSLQINFTASESLVKPGLIIPWAGPKLSIPAGFLYCNGAVISRSTYSQLFDAISTSWGNGNGTSTFNIPDSRGQFLRGASDGTGLDPNADTRTGKPGGNTGDNVGSYQTDEFKTHQHVFGADDQVSPQGGYTNIGSFGYDATSAGSGGGVHLRTKNDTTNSGGTETRPKNANVYYIIKY